MRQRKKNTYAAIFEDAHSANSLQHSTILQKEKKREKETKEKRYNEKRNKKKKTKDKKKKNIKEKRKGWFVRGQFRSVSPAL